MDKPFQRKGSASNTEVGRDFEQRAKAIFAGQGLHLISGVPIAIGITEKKAHSFDLGDVEQKVLVECKAHTWTEGGNVPSAKMTTWNQAMFYSEHLVIPIVIENTGKGAKIFEQPTLSLTEKAIYFPHPDRSPRAAR